MAENRQYDHEYKVQAVKLAKEIGQAKAAKELGIPKNTMYGWVRADRLGNLDLGAGSQTPRKQVIIRIYKYHTMFDMIDSNNGGIYRYE